jgi:outer membrane protein TolC
MKAWDRTTVSVGFDQSMMLQFPTKTAKAGEVAFAEAQAAGERFRAAKFDLQQQVLVAWWQYVLTAEKVRIQREQVALLNMLADSAAQRVRSGGAQANLLNAQTQAELAVNELENMHSELTSMRAMLNAMLARPADAPLAPPPQLPPPRPIPAGDDVLIAAAVDQNPDLAALAREVAGRSDAVELARMAYIPDIVPQFSMTGSISQAVGAMVMLPTTLRQIRASIEEARSMLRGTQAMARQTRYDRASQFVATLVALRNNERQTTLFDQSILRRAEQTLDSAQRAYSTGSIGFADLIDSQRMLLEARLMIAEARMDREQRLVELERLAGLDIETLAAGGGQLIGPADTATPTTENTK